MVPHRLNTIINLLLDVALQQNILHFRINSSAISVPVIGRFCLRHDWFLLFINFNSCAASTEVSNIDRSIGRGIRIQIAACSNVDVKCRL